MKRVKKPRCESPRRRGRRLILVLAGLVLLLFLVWLSKGCPLFSKQREFSRSLANAMMPDASYETTVQTGTYRTTLSIGSNDYASYTLLPEGGGTVRFSTFGTFSLNGVLEYPAVDGVHYVLFHDSASSYNNPYNTEDIQKWGAIAAVKTEGLRAELSLVLEDGPRWQIDASEILPGGSFPLLAGEEQDGWTCFSVDTSIYPGEESQYDMFLLSNDSPDPAVTYLAWMCEYLYKNWRECQTMWERDGHFQLTLYDETDRIVKVVEFPACEW